MGSDSRYRCGQELCLSTFHVVTSVTAGFSLVITSVTAGIDHVITSVTAGISLVFGAGIACRCGVLGSLIGLGGLGFFILRGLQTFSSPVGTTQIIVGTVLSVVLAVAADLSLAGLERALTPWTRRSGVT